MHPFPAGKKWAPGHRFSGIWNAICAPMRNRDRRSGKQPSTVPFTNRPERVWQTFFYLVDTYPCDPSGESELCACFDRALTHLARHTRDKAHLLVTML